MTITPGNRRTSPTDVLIGIRHAREAGLPLEGNPRHHAWITQEQFLPIADRTHAVTRGKIPTNCRFRLEPFMGGLRAVPAPYIEPTPAAEPVAEAA